MRPAFILPTLLVLFASSISHVHAQEVGVDMSSSTMGDDDDDEAFFSGGSNPALSEIISAPRKSPKVDVLNVCQAVLADDAALYAKRIYDACRVTVSQKPSRQASR